MPKNVSSNLTSEVYTHETHRTTAWTAQGTSMGTHSLFEKTAKDFLRMIRVAFTHRYWQGNKPQNSWRR